MAFQYGAAQFPMHFICNVLKILADYMHSIFTFSIWNVKVILFLTDGHDCSVNSRQECTFDGGNFEEDRERDKLRLVLDLIEKKQKELKDTGSTGKSARIFTFSMTNDADDRIPKMIACGNDGSWSAISGEV